MNLRSGIDTIEISRISELNPAIKDRFIQRVYTEAEITQAQGRSDVLSGIFAAKEAVSKALGTGIGVVNWHDIEIIHQLSGQPIVILHGKAEIISEELGLTIWSVSISHDRNKAIGMAVAIGEQ